ncbi:hypothetical protein [Arthrobacter sp. BF1]|uniref:hypothetical protein n=1 Tax=Arthrobacter sp. BF1 TaxID=2821145 RepID=UPI001C4F5825|nr:hypothetical protein [Arthrobacter sp. BF1]
MNTMRSNTVRLSLVCAVSVLALGLTGCTATSGPPQLSDPPSVAAEAAPSQTATAGQQGVPHPVTQGENLGSYASAPAPGGSAQSGGGFDANGAGLDFQLNCQGAGTVTVLVTGASGDAEAGITSFKVPCEDGKLTSAGNRDYTPHGTTSVSVSAPATVTWAMSVGAVPDDEKPPA